MSKEFVSDGNFAIHVSDLDIAERFYSDVLGFKLIEKTASHLVYQTGAFILYVNKDIRIRSFIPALEVKNLAKAKEHLTENGAAIIHEFDDSPALYFEDPFGNVIDIIETDE